jgi:hypothetical protein
MLVCVCVFVRPVPTIPTIIQGLQSGIYIVQKETAKCRKTVSMRVRIVQLVEISL